MRKHPLIHSLLSLTGNPRACVYTEPLFGIPYFLYIPYASIYMVSLGLSDQQIGLIVSIGMGFQIFTALLSGAITDKFGRRMTTFFSDLVAWTIPAFILIFAQNFWFFLAAAIFNSSWRISHTSWTCLMVEDAEPDQIVPIWTWIYISGLLPAFFAPLSGRLIERFDLVPAVRGLYLFAFIFLTLKFIVLLIYSTETRRGKERISETQGQSIFSLLKEYRGVANQIIRAPATVLTLGLLIVIAICNNVTGTFWAILVTQKLGIPAQQISFFPFVRALVMLGMFFLITPRINKNRFQNPMLVGFCGLIASQCILITMPPQNYGLLILSVVLEAGSIALVNPLVDSLVFFTVEAKERARMVAILYVVVFIFSSPFGWIAGTLSAHEKTYPFLLILVLYTIGLGLTWLTYRLSIKEKRKQAV
jgi:DHA1 family tetracycline resistance protein-like MFS transporter